MKAYFILVAFLVGTLFPVVAHAQRHGTQVDVWNPHLGPFDWTIKPTAQPDGTVHFHIVLTIVPYWPEVSLAHGPAATLSEAYFNPRHEYYEIAKDIRPLKLTIVGKSAQCDFSVTEQELKNPNICLAFSLWAKERKEEADFALLNDFFQFPKAALAQLADPKTQDRRLIARKIATAVTSAHRAVELERYVPALIPYLNDKDKLVREAMVQALLRIRKPAEQIIPALIHILDMHVRAQLRDPADESIIRGLDEMETGWRARPEFSGKIRQYVESFPENWD